MNLSVKGSTVVKTEITAHKKGKIGGTRVRLISYKVSNCIVKDYCRNLYNSCWLNLCVVSIPLIVCGQYIMVYHYIYLSC